MGKFKSDSKSKSKKKSKGKSEASGAVEAAERLPTASAATQLTRRYTDALDMARIIHGSQVRKGTTIPYLAHLMDVSSIVLEYGGTEDEAIAGLLHDAAEDGGGARRVEAIRAEFGDGVAAIVADLSDSSAEDKSDKDPWIQRKAAYVDHVEEIGEASLLVCAADKLANVSAICADHRRLGAGLWERFNADSGRIGQLWYYRQMSEILVRRMPTGRPAELAGELRSQVDQLWADVERREKVTHEALMGEFDSFKERVAAVVAAGEANAAR